MYSWATVGGHGGRFLMLSSLIPNYNTFNIKGDVVRYGRATRTLSGGMMLCSKIFYFLLVDFEIDFIRTSDQLSLDLCRVVFVLLAKSI